MVGDGSAFGSPPGTTRSYSLQRHASSNELNPHSIFPHHHHHHHHHLHSTMSDPDCTPVTRIACFKFRPEVTSAQKGDRTRAFLGLYAAHKDLILEMPQGGRPLESPLKLTNVKRETGWDTGFVVKFKVRGATGDYRNFWFWY
jgi:hypothetical protein